MIIKALYFVVGFFLIVASATFLVKSSFDFETLMFLDFQNVLGLLSDVNFIIAVLLFGVGNASMLIGATKFELKKAILLSFVCALAASLASLLILQKYLVLMPSAILYAISFVPAAYFANTRVSDFKILKMPRAINDGFGKVVFIVTIAVLANTYFIVDSNKEYYVQQFSERIVIQFLKGSMRSMAALIAKTQRDFIMHTLQSEEFQKLKSSQNPEAKSFALYYSQLAHRILSEEYEKEIAKKGEEAIEKMDITKQAYVPLADAAHIILPLSASGFVWLLLQLVRILCFGSALAVNFAEKVYSKHLEEKVEKRENE